MVAARDGAYPWIGWCSAPPDDVRGGARQFSVLHENRALATTDALTGLPNRVRLHEMLDELDTRHLPAGRTCAILLIDLDDFKPVNDTLGHDAGDALLVHVAQVLRTSVRSSDTAARLGGDEFALILVDVQDSDQAVQVAERVLDALKVPVEIAGRKVSVGASIGITLAQKSAAGTDDLLHQADLPCTRQKNGTAAGAGACSSTAPRTLGWTRPGCATSCAPRCRTANCGCTTSRSCNCSPDGW